MAVFVGLLVAVMWLLGAWLGPKVRTPVKQLPFECGERPFENPGRPFAIKFYLIAILFVVFDIELAYLFPWAVIFRELGTGAFVAMLVFIGLLAFGLWYDWKKGALHWE
jgi:NADH-quinone oxidoreductase subunit A